MNDKLPPWRITAPPGISLAAAMSRQPLGATPATAARTPALDPALTRILRPQVAPRWRSARVSTYTPQYVEYTLANALAGDVESQWDLFDLMEDTWPRLAKDLGDIRRSVAAMKWTVEPWAEDDETTSPEADARARLVSNLIWRMKPDPAQDELGFTGIVSDLLDAWGKGISLIELLWEERTTPTLGDIIAPRAGQWVHPSNYGVTEDGAVGLRLEGESSPFMARPASGLAELPPYKFLVGISKAKSSHWSGAARLRPLAWWWAASNFSAEWLLNYAQLFGVPVRWANYPTGAADATITAIGDMLANLGSAGWAAFPEGTALNLLDGSKGAGQSPQDSILDRADKLCDLLILGQSLTSETSGVGSNALGQVHERIRGDVIQSAADWVAGVLTQQLVPAILELNFGEADFAPELKAEPISEEDWKGMADRDAVLLSNGVALPKEWFYERHDIPLPKPDEEVIGGPIAVPPMPGSDLPPGAQTDGGGGVGSPDAPKPPITDSPNFAGDTSEASQASIAAPSPPRDPVDPIALRKAEALAAAFRGSLAPVRKIVLDAESPSAAMQALRAFYADWSPERTAAVLEDALQVCAAAAL